MRIVEIEDVEYAVDLNWYTAEGPGIRKDISTFTRSEGYSYGVNYTSKTEYSSELNAIDQITGFKKDHLYQVGATDDKDGLGKISLARVLADFTVSSSLFCLTINEGEKWILAVSGNRIVIETDCVVSDDDARSLLERLFEELIGTHSDETPFVCIFDDLDLLDLVAEHDEDFVELVGSREEALSSGLLDGSIDSVSKKSKIRNIDGNSGIKLLSLMAVIGLSYYGYSEYKSNKAAQEKIREKAKSIVKQEDNGPTREEIISEAREQEMEWLNSSLQSYSNIDLIETAIRYYNATPRLMRGWSPVKIYVDAANMKIEWESIRGTSSGIYMYLKNEFKSHSFSSKGDAVTASKSISLKKIKGNKSAYDTIKNAPDRIWVIDRLQKKKRVSWEISNGVITKRPERINGLQNESESISRVVPYFSSDFKVRGSGFSDLRGLYQVITENNGIKIMSVSIDFNNKNWEVDGEYYEIK